MHGDIVNGKRYWMQENGQGAIWYDSQYGIWKIGEKSIIGERLCHKKCNMISYSADNLFGPHGVTKWKYTKYGKWYFDDDSDINLKIAGT